MAKATKWIGAGVAIAFAGALALPWPAGADLPREIASQFAGAAGLQPIVVGRATFSLLPAPGINLYDVTISDESRTLLVRSGRLEGKLRLLPLIAGRFELAGLTLHNPDIEVDLGKIELAEQGAISRTARAQDESIEAGQAERERLGDIALRNGTARIRNSSAGPQEVILSAIDATLDWRSPRTPAALGGKAVWRGETFEVTALLSKPADLLRSQASPFNLSITSPLAALRIDGELVMAPRWQFAGALKADTRSAAGVAKLLHWPVPSTGIEKIQLAGASRINAQGLLLSGAKLDVEGNALAGTLSFLKAETAVAITGTLATSRLVLDPRNGSLPDLFAGDSWSIAPINPALLTGLSMDLRLSLNELRIGRLAIADVAISSLIQDGRLEFSLSSAKAYSGTLKARLGFTGPTTPPNLRAFLQLENVDSFAFLRDTIGAPRLSGALTGEADLRASGNTVLQMVQRAQGSVQATIAKGAVQGLELDRALQQAQTHPLSLPSEIRTGRTVFSRASMTGMIEDGALKLANTFAESDRVVVSIAGLISLVTRTLELDVEASKPVQSAETPVSDSARPVLKLDVKGPWNNPYLQFDTEGLINNSEAAAPLGRAAPKPSRAPRP